MSARDALVDAIVGDVEEANATVGAALCGGTVPDRFGPLLRDVQNDLLDLAAALSAPDAAGGGPVVGGAVAVQQVRAAVEEHRTEPVPAGFAVLGGSTTGVGLLRIARMGLRRAVRSARRSPLEGHLADYLDAVAELLLVVAFESELADGRELIAGWCAGTGPTGAAAIVPPRSGPDWLSSGQTAPRS